MAEKTQNRNSWKQTNKQAKKNRSPKRTVSLRGATKLAQKGHNQRSLLHGFKSPILWKVSVMIVFIVSSIAVTWLWLENTSRQKQAHFSIKEVEVTGNYEFLDMNEVSSLIQSYSDGDFFNVEIDNLREELVALPWVREVALRREWPNKLVVELYEQQAVAIWQTQSGKLRLLNDQGEMFKGINQIDHTKYPLLGGAEDMQFNVLQEYAKLYVNLKTQRIRVTGLSVDARNTWKGILNNGITFSYLGKNRELALKHLGDALAKFSPNEIKQIESIDLRYSNGFAVAKRIEKLNTQALDPKS